MSTILTWVHRGGGEGYIQTPAPMASNNAPRVSKRLLHDLCGCRVDKRSHPITQHLIHARIYYRNHRHQLVSIMRSISMAH